MDTFAADLDPAQTGIDPTSLVARTAASVASRKAAKDRKQYERGRSVSDRINLAQANWRCYLSREVPYEYLPFIDTEGETLTGQPDPERITNPRNWPKATATALMQFSDISRGKGKKMLGMIIAEVITVARTPVTWWDRGI